MCELDPQRPKALEKWPNATSCPAELEGGEVEGAMIRTVMGGPYLQSTELTTVEGLQS